MRTVTIKLELEQFSDEQKSYYSPDKERTIIASETKVELPVPNREALTTLLRHLVNAVIDAANVPDGDPPFLRALRDEEEARAKDPFSGATINEGTEPAPIET